MYDIAIVGLGPAGSILAQRLSKKYRVIAIDKKHGGQSTFKKPCGGLLAPDAQKSLSRLGLNLPKSVLVDPQIFSVRTLDQGTGRLRHYQRFYLNLDRHAFDAWLISLVPTNVDIADDATVLDISKCADGWQLSYTRQGASASVAARIVIGCDGASSIVRRAMFPQAHIRSYVSIQQWFRDANPSAFYSCVFDPQVTDCYSWAISKNEYFIFGGAYPAQGCRSRFEAQKQKLEQAGFHFGAPLKTEACLVFRPSAPGAFVTGRDGAFLAGEAAGFISPSSLEGISYAIDSACILADVLNAGHGAPEIEYRRKTTGLRCKLMLKSLKSPFMYNPTLRRIVMASGLNSIDML